MILSEYSNSGLVSFPANTSSCVFTVFTPCTFFSSFLLIFSITFLSSFLFEIFSVVLFSCLFSITFLSVFYFNSGCFLLCCCEVICSLTSSFSFLVSASFLINPTKLYPGIEEISGNLSPTFKL